MKIAANPRFYLGCPLMIRPAAMQQPLVPPRNDCSLIAQSGFASLCEAFLINVDEVSTTDWQLFQIVDVILKDASCYSTNTSIPRFAGICMLFSGVYLQLLSVLPSGE